MSNDAIFIVRYILKAARKLLPSLVALFLFAFAGVGCGLPGTKAPDKDVLNQQSYHTASSQCQNMDLSSSHLTPAATRGLLNCLNSRHQMDALVALVNELSDQELAPVSAYVDEMILQKPQRLYELDTTLRQLDSAGLLSKHLAALVPFLEQGPLVRASINLAHHIYFKPSLLTRIRWLEPQADTELLKALEILGSELQPISLQRALQYSSALLGHPASTELKHSLQTQSALSSADRFTLSEVIENLADILQSSNTSLLGVSPGRSLTQRALQLLGKDNLNTNTLWPLIDSLTNDRTLLNDLSLAKDLIYFATDDDSRFLKNAATFFTYTQSIAPESILCARSTSTIQDLRPESQFNELDHIDLKSFLGALIISTPLCQYPSELLTKASTFLPLTQRPSQHYLLNIIRNTSTPPLRPRAATADAMAAAVPAITTELDSSRRFLIDSAARADILNATIPLLTNLRTRHALEPILLLASALRIESREEIMSVARILSENRASLGNKSIWDILDDGLQRVDSTYLIQLARASVPMVDQSRESLAPAAAALLAVHNANAALPFFSLLKDTLSNARAQEPFLSALFNIVDRHPLAFAKAIEEAAVMAQENDGRLRMISLSLMNVFAKQSERGRYPLASNLSPRERSTSQDVNKFWRHQYNSADLNSAWEILLSRQYPSADQITSCRRYDTTFSYLDFSRPDYTSQINWLAECLGHTPMANPYHFVLPTPLSNNAAAIATPPSTDTRNQVSLQGGPANASPNISLSDAILTIQQAPVVGQLSLVKYINRISEKLSLDAVAKAMSSALAAISDGRLIASIEAFPVFYKHGTFQPLLTLLEKFYHLDNAPHSTHQQSTNHNNVSFVDKKRWLMQQTAQICQRQSASEDTFEAPSCQRLPLADAVAAVWRQIKPIYPNTLPANESELAHYTEQLVDEYLTSLDHDFYDERQTALTNTWNKQQYEERWKTLASHLVNYRDADQDPSRRNEFTAISGAIRFFRGINDDFNPFHLTQRSAPAYNTADKMTSFLIEQANRFSVIPYFYRGQTTPKLKLVSNLDRLALLLENTEITLNGIEPGVLGLMLFSGTWRGYPASERPTYITDDESTFELSVIVNEMDLGVPAERNCDELPEPSKPYCYSRLRNLKGTPLANFTGPREYPYTEIPGLITMFYEYATPGEDCRASLDACFGLKMIRNMFSSINEHIPAEYRNPFDDEAHFIAGKNNLKIMIDVARTGVFRKAALIFLGKSANTREENDMYYQFMRAGAELAHSPETLDKLESLLKAVIGTESKTNWDTSLMRQSYGAFYDAIHSDSSQLADALFYASAALPKAGLLEVPTKWLPIVIDVLEGAFRSEHGRQALKEVMPYNLTNSTIQSLPMALSTQSFLNLTKVLYDETATWQQFRSRFGQAKTDTVFPLEGWDHFTNGIINELSLPASHALYRDGIHILLQETAENRMIELALGLGRHRTQIQNVLDVAATRSTDLKSLTQMMGRQVRMRGH